MARPIKEGLDYFPLDTVMEDKVYLMEAECGLEGFAIYVKLYQKIYQNSFYIEWGEDNALLFSRNINADLSLLNDVINVCLKRELFNKEMYEKHKILTSYGIQKRYFKIYNDARRKGLVVEKDYLLVNTELTGVNVTLTRVNTELTPKNTELSTQRKEKKNKEDKSKEDKSKKEKKFNPRTDDYTKEFLEIYDMYPKPGGKRQGMINFYKKLKKYDYEMLLNSIKNYAEMVKITKTQQKYIVKFSNFFGQKAEFEDYLPGEYVKPKPKSNKNSFHDMQSGKDYSEEELNEQLGLA